MRRLTPRMLKILLAISVTLNLIVAGVVVGAVMRHPSPDDPGRNFVFGPFSGAMTKEDRREMREAFRAGAPEFRRVMGEMKGEFGEILGLLRADTFDAARFAAIIEGQRQRGDRMMALGQSVMAQHIEAMTPEARRAFADRLEHELARRHGPRD